MELAAFIIPIILFFILLVGAAMAVWNRIMHIKRNILLGKPLYFYKSWVEDWAFPSKKEVAYQTRFVNGHYESALTVGGSSACNGTGKNSDEAENNAAKVFCLQNGINKNAERMRNMLLIALGQKKMFERPLVGIMHMVIYVGFILINIELLEIILDGLTGQHRLFAPVFGSFYTWLIGFFELVGLLVSMSCVVFLVRRNVLKLGRFQKPEMVGWASLDANLILFFEMVLVTLLYTMNATDSVLQARGVAGYVHEGMEPMRFLISQALIPIYSGFSNESLKLLERVAWWGHICGIISFSIYVTYSKHLHIVLAFFNTYYADLRNRGQMKNMENITKEVKLAMGLIEDTTSSEEVVDMNFGAKDVQQLSWKNILDAYTCTECGRCTSVCPANLTGKKLSPRKIMMDTRDRAELVGIQLDNNNGQWQDDGKALYGHHISKEEILACTTCNACVEACPVNINPLDIILQIRRHITMEEANVPDAWKSMFANVENTQAPWAFPASDRFKWAEEIK
ncbi:MAG: (Fe-S)-binding protein [Cytophagales bacterium]|nr:MAG: (Fe-S)-binding protein [Cytophagales bacterium]TAF59933.1 MAG: (Fe-S)-binding protein [Cytophagales bacterium]